MTWVMYKKNGRRELINLDRVKKIMIVPNKDECSIMFVDDGPIGEVKVKDEAEALSLVVNMTIAHKSNNPLFPIETEVRK